MAGLTGAPLVFGPIALMAVGIAAGAGMLLAPAGLRLAGRIGNTWLSILFAAVLLHVAWKSPHGAGAPAPGSTRAVAPLCARSPGHQALHLDTALRACAWLVWHPCRLAAGTAGRLAHKSKAEFAKIMSELNLPKPKLIDIAVPANHLGQPQGA